MTPHGLLALLVLPAAAVAQAPAPTPVATSFEEAVGQGKLSFNARARVETVKQTGLHDSDAYTVGARLGYTTAPLNGFQAMLEGDAVVSLGDEDDYNAAGTNPGGAGHAVIGDPPGAGINQAWVSYRTGETLVKVGRQRMRLDNMRFVGDAAWRQNMMTFDAVTATHQTADKLNMHYSYLWHVSRPFFNEAPQRDWDSNSHLLNVSFGDLGFGKLTVYGYMLDFDNSPANSSNSFGASFAGSTALTPEFKLSYRAEYATQSDAGDNQSTTARTTPCSNSAGRSTSSRSVSAMRFSAPMTDRRVSRRRSPVRIRSTVGRTCSRPHRPAGCATAMSRPGSICRMGFPCGSLFTTSIPTSAKIWVTSGMPWSPTG